MAQAADGGRLCERPLHPHFVFPVSVVVVAVATVGVYGPVLLPVLAVRVTLFVELDLPERAKRAAEKRIAGAQ